MFQSRANDRLETWENVDEIGARIDYKFIKRHISRWISSSKEGKGILLPFGFALERILERRRVVKQRPVGRGGNTFASNESEEEAGSWTGRGRNEKERKRRRDGLIEAGMMFNSKKLKTRPANYAASHAINLEEDWTRRGKRKKRRKRSEKKRREN